MKTAAQPAVVVHVGDTQRGIGRVEQLGRSLVDAGPKVAHREHRLEADEIVDRKRAVAVAIGRARGGAPEIRSWNPDCAGNDKMQLAIHSTRIDPPWPRIGMAAGRPPAEEPCMIVYQAGIARACVADYRSLQQRLGLTRVVIGVFALMPA